MQKIIFEVKIYKNIGISDTTSNSVSTSTLLCVTSNLKNSSHKMWQTSNLVLKPLQIQTLGEKNGGTCHIMSPPSKKVRGTRPPPNCAHAHRSTACKTRVEITEKFAIITNAPNVVPQLQLNPCKSNHHLFKYFTNKSHPNYLQNHIKFV